MLHNTKLNESEIREAIAFWFKQRHKRHVRAIEFGWAGCGSEYWNFNPEKRDECPLSAEVETIDIKK